MSKCDKCGVEINLVTDGHPRTTPWHTHSEAKCLAIVIAQRDRLAARLAEATRALGDAHHVLGNCEDHQVFAAKCARCIIEKALGYT